MTPSHTIRFDKPDTRHNPTVGTDQQAGALKELPSDEIGNIVQSLVNLSPVAFDLACKREAPRIGCTIGALKREVKAARGEAERTGSGRPFNIAEIEPWPDPVDGAWLLNELVATFRRFVVLPDECAYTTAALWTLYTFAFAHFHVAPILVATSPERRCGKTTLFDLLARLVCAPLFAGSVSPGALFRVIEKSRPTVLLDDFDSWGRENDELRAVLNSGHRKGGMCVRCVGEDSEPRGFDTFAPKAINLIGCLHPTLEDRSIVITMRRKLPAETVVSLHDFDGEILRRWCARWAADNSLRIQSTNPPIPEGLINRQADNWRPLLTLADVAGGLWPDRARVAAAEAIKTATGDESLGIMLLADIRSAFDHRQCDRLPTDTLISTLTDGMVERPWLEISHGKPINSRRLAKLLKPFGIQPNTIRLPDGHTPKGYLRAWFDDAFARYLPGELSATAPQCGKTNDSQEDLSATCFPSVADKRRAMGLENKGCGAVADAKPQRPDTNRRWLYRPIYRETTDGGWETARLAGDAEQVQKLLEDRLGQPVEARAANGSDT